MLTSPLLLAACLAFAPASSESARLELDAAGLDAAAVEAGLRARVGDAAIQGWTIHVRHERDNRYRVILRGPGLVTERRTLQLIGSTQEDRSRELAASLALILDEAGQTGSSEAKVAEATRRPTGLLALDTTLALGPARDPDLGLGLGLTGGAWLVRDHLQPRARVGWQHGWAGALRIQQVQAGLGVAAGASIGPWWLGALVLPAVEWIHARQVRAASTWQGGGELSVLVQHRHRALVVGLRTGIDLSFPAVRVPGTEEVVRWGHVRWLVALELGFGLPPAG